MDDEELQKCEICLKGKMTALPFAKGNPPCTEKLKLVHSDVVGPMRVESLEGARFFITFIDDSTRYCEVYLLKKKSAVLEAFNNYKNLVEKQTGYRVKGIQSDNGREYINDAFDGLLKTHGIETRYTVPYTPQQNEIAERMNRTLVEMARCML